MCGVWTTLCGAVCEVLCGVVCGEVVLGRVWLYEFCSVVNRVSCVFVKFLDIYNRHVFPG